MIDGIDWAGKGGCLCAGCRAAVFSEFEESEDRESMCESEREERKRERSNRKWREGRRRKKRESKRAFLVPFRQTRCLQLHAESYHRTWHGSSQTGPTHRSPFPQGWLQLTHTQSAQCRENMPKMTTPQATAHGKEREREREGEREKWGKQKQREGARETHRRACFIKVQVQDLSDCQVALSFSFHINVVSFLPPLSSPALLHTSPCSVVCSLLRAPLTPRRYTIHRGARKFGKKLSALQSCNIFWTLSCDKAFSNQSNAYI